MKSSRHGFKSDSACSLLMGILLCLVPMNVAAERSRPIKLAQASQPEVGELHPVMPHGVIDRVVRDRDPHPTPERPHAVIIPEQLTVEQGKPARFESGSTPREGLNEVWIGPGDQRGKGPSFEVRTEDLAPDTYEVKLVVTKRGEHGVHASAKLVVTEAPAPPQPPGGGGDGGTDEPQEYSARIDSDTQEARQSQPVTFTAKLIPGRSGVRFRFHFGDDTSEETRIGSATHVYEKTGTFEAFAEVLDRRGGHITESNHISIEVIGGTVSQGDGGVHPDYIWIWTAIALLGGIGAGYLLFARRKETIDTGKGQAPSFDAIPKSDAGVQDIAGETSRTLDAEVSFAPVADSGEQEITTEQEPIIRGEREND